MYVIGEMCAASHIKADVDNLANQFPNTDAVLLEVDRRRDELEKLIQSHDIVIRSNQLQLRYVSLSTFV